MTGPDRSAEINQAIGGLKSPSSDERVATCKSLSFSGITDEKVYDLMEQDVLTQFAKVPPRDRGSADHDVEQEIGWCAKALAYSGNDKYKATLEKIVNHGGRIADHATTALERLESFKRWNPIMDNWASHRPGESWEATRAFNMLKSGDPQLQREGLKLIKELKEDPTPLQDWVENALQADYGKFFDHGSEQEDLLAWYCRALAASRNAKYRDTLVKVAEGSTSDKIRTYAKRALSDLDAAK